MRQTWAFVCACHCVTVQVHLLAYLLWTPIFLLVQWYNIYLTWSCGLNEMRYVKWHLEGINVTALSSFSPITSSWLTLGGILSNLNCSSGYTWFIKDMHSLKCYSVSKWRVCIFTSLSECNSHIWKSKFMKQFNYHYFVK